MPRNAAVGDSPMDWYHALPAVTKIHVTICLLTVAATFLHLIHPYSLVLTWDHIRMLQLWRLFTNYFSLGKLGFPLLFKLFWIIQYGVPLETITYQHNTADYIYMYLVGMMAMNVIALLLPVFNFGVMGGSLVFMLLYVWSKNFATTQCNIYGLVTIKGFYLPFAFIAVSIIISDDWKADFLGLLGGHMYYFLKVVHPAAGGVRLLDTPRWLNRVVAQYRIGTVPHAATDSQNPTNPGFRAFRGGGRTLGGS